MPNFNTNKPVDFNNVFDVFNQMLNQKPIVENFIRNNKFEQELVPGRILLFKINNELFFGILLTSGTLIKIDSSGKVRGYINNFSSTSPYEILKIVEPTKDFFQLKDYDKMKVVWEIKPKLKKTIAEIEKELNLEPGSLTIID